MATGLGDERAVVRPQPEVEIAPVRLVGKEPVEQEELDYNSLEVPTNIRRNPRTAASFGNKNTDGDDMEYLDIPAFLRRQAD